jgi:hypothetical protein
MQQFVELKEIVPLGAPHTGRHKVSNALPTVEITLIGPQHLGQSGLLSL